MARPVIFRPATALVPGAIAIVELRGASDDVICALTDQPPGPVGSLHLRRFVDHAGELIDTGIVARVSGEVTWLMPHGGMRIMQRLRDALHACGAVAALDAGLDPRQMFPEADSRDEGLMLAALASAPSTAAVDILLDQPRRWQTYRASEPSHRESLESIRKRSRFLNHLLVPPIVVVVGPPNAGKSTLTNALVGRSASIASDFEGTTRDYVGILVDLAGLTVWWCDTAGRRKAVDEIESSAMRISDSLIRQADFLIAADSPDTRPQAHTLNLNQTPDLRLHLKADLDPAWGEGSTPESGVRVSVQSDGQGVRELVQAVRSALVPEAMLNQPGPWLFDERLLD